MQLDIEYYIKIRIDKFAVCAAELQFIIIQITITRRYGFSLVALTKGAFQIR